MAQPHVCSHCMSPLKLSHCLLAHLVATLFKQPGLLNQQIGSLALDIRCSALTYHGLGLMREHLYTSRDGG